MACYYSSDTDRFSPSGVSRQLGPNRAYFRMARHPFPISLLIGILIG
jgi:hypothetical protein